jgi:hypothetical protein
VGLSPFGDHGLRGVACVSGHSVDKKKRETPAPPLWHTLRLGFAALTAQAFARTYRPTRMVVRTTFDLAKSNLKFDWAGEFTNNSTAGRRTSL